MTPNSHLVVDEPITQLGRNLTYGLLDSIGRAVVTGHYENEAFPTEAELAKQHGVSRSVTREAVKMLTAKGLLSARPRQGTTVQPTSSWNLFDTDVLRWMLERQLSVGLLRQFNELRVAVEPEAASIAASVADENDIKRIDEGLERMRAAEHGLDDPLESDIAFHVAVLRASKNPFYIQLKDVVGTALRTSIRFTNRIKGRTADVAEHAKVRDAIAARDPAAARLAMRTIIGDVLVLIEDRDPAFR
ncbi:FadR/GntR family transcriptional regulator [Edaphosphingomonas haloaromaticamans]|uniref:HTH-type transcriptional regulator LutR n=1 Tax=Edaphosphingomonas haloaromaticamans TaxID=653954 RepID=A0A1S1HEL6_9SPHN|nr:FadR/GntR family transcriptional regulator [Sphingomonas haloaromaticamans]OHT20634.1 HTH-type transcriptional regulator LutR [Sphingomonas haloaromaticamans]